MNKPRFADPASRRYQAHNRFQARVCLPETRQILDAADSMPSRKRLRVIDDLVYRLKTSGVWPKLGVLYIFAAHSQKTALLDWKNPSGTPALAVNSPTFIEDRGFSGNGVSAYVDTQKPFNAIPGAQQDNVSLGSYIHFNGSFETFAVGLIGASSANLGRTSGGLFTSRLTATTAVNADAVTNSAGTHLLASRSLAASFARYIDGLRVTDGVVASSSFASGNLTALRLNTSYAGSTASIRALHAGVSLSDNEAMALRNALQIYMLQIGAA